MKRILAATASAALALTAAPLAADEADGEKVEETARDRGLDQEAFDELTQGRTAGEPRSCVTAFNSNRIRVVEHVGVVYEDGDTTWIALAHHPRRLDYFDVPVFERYGSQLCKFDRITLVDRSSGMFSGVLFLEDFVPYTKVEDEVAEG